MRILGRILFILLVCVQPSHAARLFTTGLEENDMVATMWSIDGGAGTDLSSTSPRSGTYHIRLSGASGKVLLRDFGVSKTTGTLTYRFYWKTNAIGIANSRIFDERSSGGTIGIEILKLSTGVMQLKNNVTATTVNSALTISADTWYRFELEHLLSDTVGTLTLRIYVGDSTTITETLSITNEDTIPTSNIRQFGFSDSAANASLTYDFDDIAVNDESGSFQTTWPGPGHVFMLVPNSEVSASFTPLSGTDNSLMVDDLPGLPDDDTTYNSHATADGEDRLGLTNLGAEVPSNATIRLVDVYARARGDSTTGTRQMRLLIWDEGGTQTNGPTSTRNDSTTYAILPIGESLVLDTSGKTKANLDSFNVGYEPLTASNTIVSAVWANVEWTEAVAGGNPRRGMLMGVYP